MDPKSFFAATMFMSVEQRWGRRLGRPAIGPQGMGARTHSGNTTSIKSNLSKTDMDSPKSLGSEMSLRMLVDARFIAAIMGAGGVSIREITSETKARCLVEKQSIHSPGRVAEKVVCISGQSEHCSKAVMRILVVVQKEVEGENCEPSQPQLKLQVNNDLVGHLIGKGGITIKKIMKESKATIFVSYDTYPYVKPRIITIRGALDSIATAEKLISAKLQSIVQAKVIKAQATKTETVHIHVPKSVANALMGSKGAHVRSIMRNSGATVRIQSKKGDAEETDKASRDPYILIIGNPVQQYQAQLAIYQRVCELSQLKLEEVGLVTEVTVHANLAGSIAAPLVGTTRARIKFLASDKRDHCVVRITGNFKASQTIQTRIRELVLDSKVSKLSQCHK